MVECHRAPIPPLSFQNLAAIFIPLLIRPASPSSRPANVSGQSRFWASRRQFATERRHILGHRQTCSRISPASALLAIICAVDEKTITRRRTKKRMVSVTCQLSYKAGLRGYGIPLSFCLLFRSLLLLRSTAPSPPPTTVPARLFPLILLASSRSSFFSSSSPFSCFYRPHHFPDRRPPFPAALPLYSPTLPLHDGEEEDELACPH